jgi:ankyrin repeat protein
MTRSRFGRQAAWSAIAAVLSVVGVAAQTAPAPSKADALWEAARKGDAAGVTAALDAGVDVNTPFRYGATALSYACDRGHLDVVRILLARGANPNVKDTFYGATPLNWASSPAQTRKPEHAEVVRLLLKHGAQGADGALGAAIGEDDLPMTEVILAHGGLAAGTLSDALEQAAGKAAFVAALEKAGAKPYPVVSLTAAQLARAAGKYSNGAVEVTLNVRDGQLVGGPPGQTLTFVPLDESTFRMRGQAGVTVTFAYEGDRAVTATERRPDGRTSVYKRVEGK